MSNQDKHITHWSPSDIQKYLKGELSAREMHQLERAALEDPFLAEAIEGLSQRPAATLANDLGELQSRLAARVGKKQRSMAWMKLAAAIVLLIGLGYTAWYMLIDKSKTDVAKFTSGKTPASTTAAAPAPAPIAAPPQANAATSDTSATVAKIILPLHKTKTEAPATVSASLTNTGGTKSVADSIDYLLKDKASGLDIMPAQANRLAVDSVKAADLELSKRLAYKALSNATYLDKEYLTTLQNQNLVFSGQVLDFNNRPLAGASLLVSGPANAITTTNALGQFKLNLRPQDTTQQLTVAMVGYQEASLAVNRLSSDQVTGNTIILHEQPAAMNEVLVTGGNRKQEAFAAVPFDDKTEKLDSFWVKIIPVTGRLAYLDYLATAKKTLPVDTTIRGAEIVSFAIDQKGAPTDFKIENSLSPAHDAGLIRLITDGARWKILRGRKNLRAMVEVSFP